MSAIDLSWHADFGLDLLRFFLHGTSLFAKQMISPMDSGNTHILSLRISSVSLRELLFSLAAFQLMDLYM